MAVVDGSTVAGPATRRAEQHLLEARYIHVDGVVRALMIDASGTRNRITFIDEALFVDIPDAEFEPDPAPREPKPLP